MVRRCKARASYSLWDEVFDDQLTSDYRRSDVRFNSTPNVKMSHSESNPWRLHNLWRFRYSQQGKQWELKKWTEPPVYGVISSVPPLSYTKSYPVNITCFSFFSIGSFLLGFFNLQYVRFRYGKTSALTLCVFTNLLNIPTFCIKSWSCGRNTGRNHVWLSKQLIQIASFRVLLMGLLGQRLVFCYDEKLCWELRKKLGLIDTRICSARALKDNEYSNAVQTKHAIQISTTSNDII